MVKTNEEKFFSIREQPNDLAQIKKNLHHPWTKSINEDQSGVVLLSTSFETENIVCVRTVRTGSIVCRRRSVTRIKMSISGHSGVVASPPVRIVDEVFRGKCSLHVVVKPETTNGMVPGGLHFSLACTTTTKLWFTRHDYFGYFLAGLNHKLMVN